MSTLKDVAWAKRIANFDMESLISSILRTGMLSSTGFIFTGLIIGWADQERASLGPNLKAKSVPLLILADLQQIGSPGFWPRFLIHLGVATLLLTPYVRVLASMAYFTWVDRSRKQVAFTGFVLIILTIILLTRLV